MATAPRGFVSLLNARTTALQETFVVPRRGDLCEVVEDMFVLKNSMPGIYIYIYII